MENEEKLEETQDENENINSQNDEEELEETEEEESNDNDLTVEDYEKLKQKNKELFERAKKAEALAKKAKSKPINKSNETQSGLTKEEAILYAKGYTDDEVELANKLSQVNGTNILVAIEDDFFKSKVALRKKKENAEKASLPASSGIGKFKSDKSPGDMTEEEHIKYFHKVMGN